MPTLVRAFRTDASGTWPKTSIQVEAPVSEVRPRLIGGQYRLEQRIGIGGMSVVYRGTQLGTERPVAVKVLRAELSTNPDIVARFQNEARVTARLRSDHVISILDAGELEGGGSFIVFEYLEGGDLGRLLAERGFVPVREAVDYVVQACDALAEAHALGIVHRDIKPENILVTRATDGTPLVKVLDFGVAKSSLSGERALTSPGTALGSPEYMPPEQLMDSSSADPRSDVWALGTVLYELLTGSRPFERENLSAIRIAILTERPAPPSELRDGVPRALDAIVLRSLQKDPSGRFANVGELARALVPFGPPPSEAIATRAELTLDYPSRRAQSPAATGPAEDRVTRVAVAVCRPPAGARRARAVLTGLALFLAGVAGAATFDARPDWPARVMSALQNTIDPKLQPTYEETPARVAQLALPGVAIGSGTAVAERDAVPVPIELVARAIRAPAWHPRRPQSPTNPRLEVAIESLAASQNPYASPEARTHARPVDVAVRHSADVPTNAPLDVVHDAADPVDSASTPAVTAD